VIKLDIVNAVVAKTNISRTKAEQAVETVFESLKNPWDAGSASNCAVRRIQREATEDRHRAQSPHRRRISIPPEKRCASSPGKNSRDSKTPPQANPNNLL